MFILLIFELTTAATINSFQLSASSYEIRIKADYFVTFSPPSAVPANGVIVFNFPIEFEDITTSSPRCSFVRNINSAAICTFSTTSVRITGGFPTQISAASNIQFIVSGVVNPQLSSSLTSFQLYTQTSEGTIVDSRTSSSTMTYTAKKLSEVIITPTSNVNGDYTTWTISTTLTYTVLSGGFISLTFPNWNVNLNPSAEQAQSFITSSLTCTGITNMPANLLCSFSSNMLRITMNQDTVGSLVFSIGPVRNPPNTKPVTGFYMSAGQTAGLSEDTTSVSISVTSSLPGLLYDASVKFNDGNSKVNAQSVYAFDFFNKNPIPSNSNLQITFPSDISVVGFVSSITSIFGFDAPSPSFTLTNQVLVITSPFLQYEVENKEINFLVDNCKNPPSSKLTDSIQIVIITSDGFLIDQVTTGLGIQAVPGTAAITSIVPTDYKINALTTYTFTFNSNESILAGCAVKIIAPSQISISDRSAGSCTSIIRGFGSSALCSVAENKNIFVTNGFLSDFGTGSIAFSLNGITNPNTINPTSTFTLQVYIDSNFQYLVSEITDKTITATPGALQSVIIQPSSDVTGEITTYTFTIVTSNTILVGGIMWIYLPSDISLVDTSSSCTFTSGFEDSAGCECTSTSIKITRGFQNSHFAPGTLKFSIGNIQNPISTKPTSSFNVRTQTSDGLDIDILDSGITLTVTTPHSFTAISVSSSSLVVGAMSDYTFSITPYNPITSGGFITITPPSDITFTIALCEYSSTVITAVSCSIIGASIRVSLTISTATLTSSFSIRLRSITNPASTKQTGSFTVSSRQSFYSLDAVSSGLTLQMTTAGTMNQVSLSTSSTGINQQSVYTFVFNTVNAVKAGGYLRLDLPSQVSSIISPICTVGGVAVTCSVSSNVFTVRMFISDTSAQRFTMVIASLINGPNTITSDTFILSTYTTDNQLVDMNSALTISFTCASPCATCNHSPSNCLSCISTSITPYFWNDQCNTDCPSGQIDLGDKICVPCSSNCHTCSITTIRCTSCVLNSGLPYLDNTSCVGTCPSNSIISNDLKCEYCDQSCLTCRNTVKTCASCIAPKVLYQDQCISNCPSDVTVALNNVCISCSTNCGTCKDSVDKCSSCNGSNLLFEDDCYSSCPEDISIQTGATCTRCLASCNTCSVTVSSCTSCTSGRYLHNSQCVALCPDGYLISGTSCLQCSQECLKCSGSANYCTSCSNDMFSYGGRCVNSCPSGISIEVEKECIKCLDSCLTCESSYDKCSSCPSDSLLYNSQCLSSCPISTYETNGQCKVCDDSCDGCIGISSNCTSCAVDYYKYENTCTVNCPDKYLGISGLCAECDETCATCEETPINCKTCIGEYSLLSNICLLNCPAGYVSENSFCIEERTDFCSDLCTDELLDNDICDPVCNTTSCEYDKNKCLGPNKTEIDDYNYRPTNYSDSLYVEKDPFGICITSTIVIGTTVSSSLITASAFLPASIGILSLIESASWWALIGIIDEEESTKGRILLEISDSDVVVAFGFLISVIIIHYALNLFFFVIYYLSVRGRDIVHKNWTNKHPWATIIACFFTVMLSFKFIRLLYCNLFHISGCNAKFERISRLLNPLVFLTFLHMILVSIPMIGILLYLLSEFSTGTLTFIVSLDILILTLLMFGLSIFDVIYMNRRMAQEIDTGVRQKSPDLAMTLHDDLTLEKANTELDTNDKTRIQECFDSLRDVHNLATKRSLLNSKSAETLEFDLNAINHNRNTVSMDLNNLIADPEETELPDVEDEGFAINVQESKANRRKTLKDLTVSEISFDIIDPIEVIEVELDLANATINKNDYETILVKHLTSNEIVAVKQGFGEGFIVDEDKVIIQPQPNFDINTFELVKIDEEDVRIGIFKNRDQETVRIKRCFDGAKLIDQSENTQTMESSERIAKSNKSSSSKLSSSHNTIITEETKRELQDEARPRATGTVSSEGIEIIKKEPSKSRLLINQIRPLASRFNFQINSNQNEFDTEEVLFERDGNWVPISTESEEFIYSSRYQ